MVGHGASEIYDLPVARKGRILDYQREEHGNSNSQDIIRSNLK